MAEQVDTVVIGAGVVGLAIARSLAMDGHEVLVLEREDAFGTITSARNSEVIHAGIYYAKDSFKAKFCVAGRHMLYAFCKERGVPYNNCGKLIVACSEDELQQFNGIAQRAWNNGVEDLRQIIREEAQDLEPELECHGALLSPSTGIVDSHGFMLALLGEAEAHGALLVLNTNVLSMEVRSDGILIRTGGEAPMDLLATKVVNSAGLNAPGLAQEMAGLPSEAAPQQWIAKGNYFSLTSRAPFERLIYPAPVAGGLGIHLTLDLNGRARFGPDVEWIDTEDYAVDPARGKIFYDAIRRYWPGLPDASLAADYSGIRPKLTRQGEKHAADFRVSGALEHGVPGYVGLYGIESPGLTSSLAIADHVRETLTHDLR
ncbi:MAG: NAD(P)/FAD-dependent oxidoreductase [Pseudomonadota bacterium]